MTSLSSWMRPYLKGRLSLALFSSRIHPSTEMAMAPRLSRHAFRARHPRWAGLIETRAMTRNSFASACSISLFRVREIPRRTQSRTILKTPAKSVKTDTAVIVMRGLSQVPFPAPYREMR